MSADLEDRLAGLAGPVPAPEPVEGLRGRIARRRRRRRVAGGALVALLAVVGLALVADGRPDHERKVRTIDHPAGSVVVPDVVGRTLAEARAIAFDRRVLLTLDEGSAADWFAQVLATDPPAGTDVPAGSKVVVSSALPAPPAEVVCPGWPTGDLPGGADTADARPAREGTTRLTAHLATTGLRNAFVARGVIKPWARVDGDIVVLDDPGYQAVVRVNRASQCPTWPDQSSREGTVVTFTVGWPREDSGISLGEGRVWPWHGGTNDALTTLRAFLATQLHDWRWRIETSSAPFNGPTWFTVRSGHAEVRVLLAPQEDGWAVMQVGDPALTYSAEGLRFDPPGPEVTRGQFVAGYGMTTSSGSFGREVLDAGAIELDGQPKAAILVYVGADGQALRVMGSHT